MDPVIKWLMDPVILDQLNALWQVLLIDIVLAGDNAVMIGMAVNGLPAHQKRPAIIVGIAGATVLRIVFSLITVQLLAIVGLMLAGGILLLWLCWKMYRQLTSGRSGHALAAPQPKTLREAMTQIIIADVVMSLDNVLAVAAASRGHTWVLVVGLVFSVVLMGVAANFVANLLDKHRWVGWLGLAVVLYVAGKMIWDGGHEVWPVLARAWHLNK